MIFNFKEFGTDQKIPLSVNELYNSDIMQFHMDCPYSIVLETCRKKEQFFHIYYVSPKGYCSLRPTNTAELFSQNPEHRALHRHSFIEMMYVLSGSVTNRIENKYFTYKAGQCCILNKNMYHCELFDDDYQVVFFDFQDDFLLELLQEEQKTVCKDKRSEPSASVLFSFLSQNIQNNQELHKDYLDCFPVISEEKLQSKIVPVFNLLVNQTFSSEAGASFFAKGAFSRLLSLLDTSDIYNNVRVYSDIDSQEFLFDRISHIMHSKHGRCGRRELVESLHYSGEYLNWIVKKYTGKTILKFGRDIFLEEAEKMLISTNKSISSIVEDSGYSNRNHFYQLFEQEYGMTPMEFRKKFRKQ